MYKDPDKQREAVKLATRRYRARVSQEQGITDRNAVITSKGNTVTFNARPKPQSYNPMMVGYVPPEVVV